jgi:hypothetical protein
LQHYRKNRSRDVEGSNFLERMRIVGDTIQLRKRWIANDDLERM